MNTNTAPISSVKPKTIDEYCKQPEGSFQKFVLQKKAFLASLETERKDRIASSRQAALEMSWAA